MNFKAAHSKVERIKFSSNFIKSKSEKKYIFKTLPVILLSFADVLKTVNLHISN
jgi:hypothetical protein